MRTLHAGPHALAARLALAVPIIAAVVVPTASADAQSYDVWSCRAPDGSPAIVRDESGGWQGEPANPAAGVLVQNSCGEAGHLEAVHATFGVHPAGSGAGWRFDAPADLQISGYTVELSGWARGLWEWAGQTQGVVGLFDSTQTSHESWTLRREGGTGETTLSRGLVSGTPGGASWVRATAGCVGPDFDFCTPDEQGISSLRIFRSTITLRDTEAPVVTGVQGDAIHAGIWPLTGVSMAISATDRGGGVLRIGVEVDGGEPQWHAVADALCRIWPGTERAFVAPKPCPSAINTTLTIPTAELGPGIRTIRVLVEDAAGNRTTAYGPYSKRISGAVGPGGDGVGPDPGAAPPGGGSDPGHGDLPGPGGGAPVAPVPPATPVPTVPAPGVGGTSILDPGPANGTPATSAVRLSARWDGTTSALRKIRYGQRPVLRGQLTTADGRPVRGAAIRVGITQDHRSANRVEHQALRTDESGSFRWRLPNGVGSRRIALAYYERVGGTAPAASRTLRLEVAASVRMTLDRRRARQGQTVRLRGQLVGRPLPKVGSVIELQARNPGRKWITFRTIRANRAGRFSAGYRFRMPGPAIFEMRARVRKSGDYPYATGVSPNRRITVR